MKSLIDKIIDLMIAYKEEHHNPIVKSSVETLIEQVKKVEREAEFEECARVVMKHLGNPELYRPHYTIIITNATAELVEGKRSIGHILDYVPD